MSAARWNAAAKVPFRRYDLHRSSIPSFRHWKAADLCATGYDGGQPKADLRI